VRDLEKEYDGRVEFGVHSVRTPEGQAAAARYEFGGARHGLVGLEPDGAVAFVMPGHNFTRDDIQQRIREMLE